MRPKTCAENNSDAATIVSVDDSWSGGCELMGRASDVGAYPRRMRRDSLSQIEARGDPLAKPAKLPRRKFAPLEKRFLFTSDPVTPMAVKTLRSAMYEVEDRQDGQERILKLWRKTGTSVDDDLRQLWLHEMRQVQRIMAYAGAREVIVDILETVEDADSFGVVLERAGQPLSTKLTRVSRQHWLRNLGASRSRSLFWRNIRRIAIALGIVHAQGLVHGQLTADVVMTEGDEEPDFQLAGFEWSLWVSADKAERAQAKLAESSSTKRVELYSFAEDWRALGLLAATCLEVSIKRSGEVVPSGRSEFPITLGTAERVLLKRLVMPTRLDNLDSDSISRAIDDVIAEVSRSAATRAGAFVLLFAQTAGLGETIYETSDGQIPVDEYQVQLDWVRGDLARGATLLVPKASGEPARLTLITSSLVCRLAPLRQDGSATWDAAVCVEVKPRNDALRMGDRDEHELIQPIELVGSVRQAVEARARLGADALDWSSVAPSLTQDPLLARVDVVRRALVLIQVIEAVLRALEVYPIEVLEIRQDGNLKRVLIRSEPNNGRDAIARRLGLTESSAALKRLFEDDHRDADVKWRLSQAPSLGAVRHSDVTAAYVDVDELNGLKGYLFEIDESPPEGQLFLRAERDTGTEQVIARRLRVLKALSSRIDLADMLDDPWRVRRSSRESLGDLASDVFYADLDEPKRRALEGLWSTLPAFFVVGPPGVGKTRLATETVRRRFSEEPATRMLLCAQGHDALDNLQENVRSMLASSGLDDLIIVRSTANERRPTSDEDVHQSGLDYLERLSESHLTRDAPPQIRDRVHSLRAAAARVTRAKDTVERDDRIGLNALSSLVLDSANIVISTANSPDVERMVEAREQFDWVLIEEAAKATGPEMVGPLMLSGRRLLIGDHHQLPPHEADKLLRILRDQGLVRAALDVAERYVGPLMRDGELTELEHVSNDPASLRAVTDAALRLFEPFRTFVEEDERLRSGNTGHRNISAVLTEQRRMDPAIAEIVSQGFYKGDLKTEARRRESAVKQNPPFRCLGDLPASPVVVIDFPHVSRTGSGTRAEHSRPRWHNPEEVSGVLDVLRHLRGEPGLQKRPTLAILTFYKAQAEKISQSVDAGVLSGELAHLADFDAVRGGSWISTVDGFQGSEADLVILSLVRNNSGSGSSAPGFLRDRRRMNVALSRAKSKLVVVGSLSFLNEAVRGVNPDEGEHDLSFITRVTSTIDELEKQSRGDGVRLASVLSNDALAGRVPAC